VWQKVIEKILIMADEYIVGHKTFYEGHGKFRHEALTEKESKAIFEQVENSRLERLKKYPDEEACLKALFDICQRLEDLGWKSVSYAPPDRVVKKTISLRCTGIHDAYCESRGGEEFLKGWWHPSEDGDLWPHDPIYFKPK
jgi:hypothetical protein